MINQVFVFMILVFAPMSLWSQLESQWSTIIERSSGHSYVRLDNNEDIIFVGGNKVAKFDPFGNEIWTKDLSGEAFLGINDLAFDHLEIDEFDNIYVLYNKWNGVYGDPERRTVLISKYSSDGSELWTNEFVQDSEYILSFAASISLHNDKIFVSGYLREGAITIDGFLLCLSAITGEEEWRKLSSTDDNTCSGRRVRVDSEGYVYNAGQAGSNNTYCTIKYDSEGEFIWNVEYSIEGDSINKLMDMVISKYDEIVLTGYSFTTVSFDNLGNVLWDTMPPSDLPASHASDKAKVILSLDDGSSIITGYHTETFEGILGSDFDAFTLKIDQNGNIVWSFRHRQGEDDRQISNSIVQDIDGDIIIAGTDGGGSSYKFLINKYSNEDGSLLWSFLDAESESLWSEITSLQVSSNSEIYVAGIFWEENEAKYLIKKYNTPLTSTNQIFLSPQDIIVYPNPSENKVFKIYSPNISTCDIDIISSTGKSVFNEKSYSNGELIKLKNAPSGLYYITVTSAYNSTTKSIIID